MIYLFDHFIIQVPAVYDDRPGETGLVPTNTAWYIAKERDRYERKLRFGTIIAAPVGYSDTNYMPLDAGIPPYRLFIGHDAIQKQVNIGYKDWEKFENYYHPGIKESFDFLSMEHYGRMIDAKVGDKVYFHPSVTEDENKMSEGIYRASADKLICVVEEMVETELITMTSQHYGWNIRPQAGHMLVEPHMDNELERDGFIIKTEAEAKMLEGTVRHIRKGAALKRGDQILFQLDADWIFEVEGIKFYAMKEDDAFVKVLA